MTQDQREECVEMEQPVEAVKEEISLWTHVVRGVKAAGRLTLGLLVPLGILAATLPISYEHQARGSCMDTFWSPALSLMEPHCTMTYLTPLPVDRVRSSVIREELGVEPLLLCIERSQLRWFGHLVRMPPGRLPREVFQARPAGRRPRGRPRTRWRDYISTLAWERLGIPQSELANVAREGEVWGPLLELLPPRPDPG
ncbi:hypothetical protein DPEC_G00218650 [Dallia pectoralis]|uniref:Uncharacterized protein n=1 Tax=Dallia pectoralis TaxID=75939 RepID=A0ACC2G2T7_DALPE|nr:hypothetical protein DPEC_G00218650 [Dallia pectoralis]